MPVIRNMFRYYHLRIIRHNPSMIVKRMFSVMDRTWDNFPRAGGMGFHWIQALEFSEITAKAREPSQSWRRSAVDR